jgi:anti-sigma factor RsiW
MTPIDTAEISAYLDGELSAIRAEELEAAIANDPALRAELEALARQHSAWRGAASSANFLPTVRLEPPGAGLKSQTAPGIALALTVLIALRVLPKLTDSLGIGLVLHSLALAAIMGWLIHMTSRDRVDS